MSVYVIPMYAAFLIFILIGIMLIIPWLIYSYRKYGYVSVWESIVTYSFIYYMLTALFLVLLPLPATRDTCSLQPSDTVHYTLVPFNFIKDIISGSSIVWPQLSTYVRLLTQTASLQAIFNFLLLMPFGVYLRYFFKHRRYWMKAFGLGFILSLFYEVTQLTGIYGIYNCPYRLFDVDDLMLNSAGALVGFLLAPTLLALFPSRESVIEKGKYLQTKKTVSPLSQLIAVMIDYFIIKFSWTLTLGFFITDEFIQLIYTIIGFMIIFFIVPFIWDGKTIGTKIMHFKLIQNKANQSFWKLLCKRFVALFLPVMLTHLVRVLQHVEIDINSLFYPYYVWGSTAAIVFLFIMWMTLVVHVGIVLAKKGKRNYYFDYVVNLKAKKTD